MGGDRQNLNIVPMFEKKNEIASVKEITENQKILPSCRDPKKKEGSWEGDPHSKSDGMEGKSKGGFVDEQRGGCCWIWLFHIEHSLLPGEKIWRRRVSSCVGGSPNLPNPSKKRISVIHGHDTDGVRVTMTSSGGGLLWFGYLIRNRKKVLWEQGVTVSSGMTAL